ncbi:hypothetical protein BJ165DRAFT_1450560 [Panaeolus papilionaceus]|nr:hypothetical protein BJ165DRAFT_1450560 [Panaeolus papilionaceus]
MDNSRSSPTEIIVEYTILQRLPTPQDYHDLPFIANLTRHPMEAVPRSLKNSFACFIAYETPLMQNETTPATGQHPVAMGRLVGDGALFLQVIDVAVHPDHLDPLGQGLYPKFGFEGMGPSIGMY